MPEKTDFANGMDFSMALAQVRTGSRVWRWKWSDTSYVVLMPGYPEGIGINRTTAYATGEVEGAVCVFEPYFLRWDGEAESFSPWVPTTRDILAMDWHLS